MRISPVVPVAIACSLLVGAPDRAFVVRGAGGPALAAKMEAGTRHFREREYSQAIRAFEGALALAAGPEKEAVRRHLASALGALGAEYFNAGESRLAEETFRRGLEQADNYYSRFGLGYLYFGRMDDSRAREHLQAALTLRGDFAGTHKLLALLDYRQGRTDSALGRLEEARRLDGKDEETRRLLERWRIEQRFLDRYGERETDRFAVRFDPQIPVEIRQRIQRELDRAWTEIGDGLGTWPAEPVAVILFGEAAFWEATGSHHWVGGMYDGQLKLPVPVSDPTPEALAELEEVIRHEYTHVLVRLLAPECPVWLNEGIAQYFEHVEDPRLVRLALSRRRSERLAFRDIPSRLWEAGNEKLARWSYLQGLGFVQDLVERHHEFRLRLLLRALTEEHSVERAFQRTYGRSLTELEDLWWARVVAESPTGDEPPSGAGRRKRRGPRAGSPRGSRSTRRP